MTKAGFEDIYIWRNLKRVREIDRLAERLDLVRPKLPPHATLIYSKAKVDWSNPVFQPRQDEIRVRPGTFGLTQVDDGLVVLTFPAPELAARWEELCTAGASREFECYLGHVSLGRPRVPTQSILALVDLEEGLVFEKEGRTTLAGIDELARPGWVRNAPDPRSREEDR